jgi:2-oxoglutarate ferredoxin oxidoreductase subunit beta
MELVFNRPKVLADMTMSYCPGCGHGIAHRLIGEVIDELDVLDRTIAVCPVGCSVFLYEYLNCDAVSASHGRAPAVATGLKRCVPDGVVFTYQGDGDIAAIGTAEIIHAGTRGENITVVFINNTTYGMTGGQMAPTTLPGQESTTTPGGRNPLTAGYPVRVCEMMATLDGVCYASRVSVSSPANVARAKKSIKKAFQNQLDLKGLSIVEILSPCPTQWGMNPLDSIKHVDEVMAKYYPLGEIKSVG